MREAKNAVVIGAGTMGGGIAAQLANAGWNVALLDTTQEAADNGLARLKANRPPLLFMPEFADKIQTGVFANSAEILKNAVWIVEAVAENMAVKKQVLDFVELCSGKNTKVTSNTSGLSLNEMVADLPPEFRQRFFGTHFLNPPRYLKLLEVIPLADTDRDILAHFVEFAEETLGHRVVMAKDTPGFISTRIWITHLLDTMHTALEQNLSVSEVDAVTGAFLGRPKSATFRMADIVGLDIIAAIAKNQYDALPDDPLRERLILPGKVQALIDSGRTGAKSGAGFYKRDGKEILALDWDTLDYRPVPQIDTAEYDTLAKRSITERAEFLRSHPADHLAHFVQTILESLFGYVLTVAPEIADDVLSIDNVMQWGFGWEHGPFAFSDKFYARQWHYHARNEPPYRMMRVFAEQELQPVPETPDYIDLNQLEADGKVFLESPVGSLIDLGNDVACLAFKTKMNTLNPELCRFIDEAITFAENNLEGLVIGNQGAHFSVGYDLKILLAAIEAKDYHRVDEMMHAVQSVYSRLKFSRIPVVAAPHGYTLGGGCECVLHCDWISTSAELQMGLPETLAGLVPNGGGMKELLLRSYGTLESLLKMMKLLVFPPTSANAYEALESGFLFAYVQICANADRRFAVAKDFVLDQAKRGYSPPDVQRIVRQGNAMRKSLMDAWQESVQNQSVSEFDVLLAEQVAEFLCGTTAAPQEVSENDLLNHEREIFQRLIRLDKTVERIRHLLETGKPLKN